MDVKDAQKWLNERFEGSVGWVKIKEDGKAGYNTMVAFVRALQIELGLEVDGGFGDDTKLAFNSRYPKGLGEETEIGKQDIVVALVNLALLCRIEVSETLFLYTFSDKTREGVTSTMNQLGIENFTGNLSAREVKAIFTSDAYYLIPNGDAKTREIQQAINRKYSDMLDRYIPTNGLYDRNMNTAIIKMIQYEIGAEVDGGWGEGTMSSLPVLGPGSSRTNLVYILQYLLYLNGFDPNGFDGGFGNGVTTALKNFQSLMKLDVDGYCGRQAWSALVVSCGDTTRSANACDTCFEITPTRAQLLKNNGFEVVGRYLTGYIGVDRPKALQDGELETILNSGLKVFLIYQENNRQITDFSYPSGRTAGLLASEAAINKKIPKDTVIYFAVDMDVYEEQIDENIIPFFRGINDCIKKDYRVGIYAPRLVCTRVAEAGLSVSSFVADMSSGYSCNVGQKIPSDWNYDQFVEISNYKGELDIDKVKFAGKIEPISSLNNDMEETSKVNKKVIDFLREAYNLASEYNGVNATVKANNSLVIKYIANREYNTIPWKVLLDHNANGVNYIKSNISIEGRDLSLYDFRYNKLVSLPHLFASLYCVLNKRTGIGNIDSIVADLTGWAGDFLQFAGNFEQEFRNNKHPIYTPEYIEQIIGANSDTARNLGFDLQDLIQDIDVWTLYKSLDEVRIDAVFEGYYKSPVINRGNRFIENREEWGIMPDNVSDSDTNYQKLYKLAKQYISMDFSQLEGLAGTAFEAIMVKHNCTIEILQENISRAFANKVTSMI